jgi:regulator of nucleoside diphosphate kinase
MERAASHRTEYHPMNQAETHDFPRSRTTPEIAVTDQDFRRLTSLLAVTNGRVPERASAALRAELERAIRLPHDVVPPDLVTMNSRVLFEVLGTGPFESTLVYPWDANHLAGRLSVLAPLGTALLGLSVADTITWTFPDGVTADVRVLSVLYQPEAAGDRWL